MYLPSSQLPHVAACFLQVATPDTLWMVCVADQDAHALPPLLATCREQGLRVFGGIFPALLHDGVRHDSGLVAIPMPAASQVVSGRSGQPRWAWQQSLPDVADKRNRSVIILTDCMAPNISGLLEEVYDHFGNAASYVGGGAGFHDLRRSPCIFTDQGLLPDAAVVALTPEKTSVGARHGWQRMSGPFVASRTEGNVIHEINWEPAGEFYRRQVAALNPALSGRPVFPDVAAAYPLTIAKEGGEDVVRDPIRIDEAGRLVVLSDVQENAVMYLGFAEPAAVLAAAGHAVADLAVEGDISRCILFDCYSRSLMLGADFARELQIAGETLSPMTAVKPDGVLAMGEIASNGKGNLEFYNKTFVVAATTH